MTIQSSKDRNSPMSSTNRLLAPVQGICLQSELVVQRINVLSERGALLGNCVNTEHDINIE